MATKKPAPKKAAPKNAAEDKMEKMMKGKSKSKGKMC
jgi:hypothetical protein